MSKLNNDYLFIKSNLFFALEKISINLPNDCYFLAILSIDDSEITLQPTNLIKGNCFQINYKYKKTINAVFTNNQTQAKVRRIVVGINVYDKSKKLISASEASINPGLFLNSEMDKLIPIKLDFQIKGISSIIYAAVSLSPIYTFIPSAFQLFSSNAVQVSIAPRKPRRGSDSFLNKLIEENFNNSKSINSNTCSS